MEKLKDKILFLYSKYREFEEIINDKNKKLVGDKANVLQLIEGKEIEEFESILQNIYVDTVLYNKDLQIAFSQLFINIETYVEFSSEGLPQDILDFYETMKKWFPKRTFMVEKGDIVETEAGVLGKAREEFLQSDFYKSVIESTKQKK